MALCDRCRLLLPAVVMAVAPGLWSQGPAPVLMARDGAAARRCLDDEVLAPYELPLEGGPSLEALSRAHGLPAGHTWALVVRGATDQVLRSGASLPEAASLARILQQAGVVPPVLQLRTFLRQHPDHLEARTAYLEALRRQALRASQRIPGTGPLTELEDLRIWGDFASELERLMRGGNWLPARLGFWGQGPAPEARSPLMRFFLKRHAPAVDAALLRDPEDFGLWSLRAWMSRVANLQGVGALLERLPASPHQLRWPVAPARALWCEELRRAGAWRDLRNQLLRAWEEQWPQIREAAGEVRAGGGSWTAETLGSLLQTTWEDLLHPLALACLELGDEGTLRTLLTSLGSEPSLQGTTRQLHALAQGRGIRNLPMGSTAASRTPLQGVDLPAAWHGHPQGLLVALGWDRMQTRRFRALLRKTPLVDTGLVLEEVPLGAAADLQLRQREGWGTGRPRWVLLDPHLKVLSTGETVPTASALHEAWRQAGLRPLAERLADFMQAHPERMDVRYACFQEHLAQAERRTSDVEGTGDLDPAQDQELWGSVAEQLEGLLQDAPRAYGGLGGRPLAPLAGSAMRSPRMRRVCVRALDAVESALERQPGDPGLWQVWVNLARGGNPSLKRLLDRLVPLPGTTPGAWPPPRIQAEYCRERLDQGDARTVRELLRQTLDAALRAEGERGRTGATLSQAVWQNRVVFLLEAHLRLGDEAAADRLLADWSAAGGWSGAYARAASLAAQLGREDLAGRWGH